MIIENKNMLASFDAADKERYYPICMDIALAGNDYKVKEVIFFVRYEDAPLSDYIQIKKYDDRFLLIGVHTEDTALISEGLEYVKGVKNEFDEIEMRTSFLSVLNHEGMNQQFSMYMPENPANPVYYIHSPSELTDIQHNSRVHISRVTEADKIEIANGVKYGKLCSECMGEGMFQIKTCFKDIIWYILRVDGDIAGYLRAECGYANIYDIGWLYVLPRYRGNGYAAELVSYFSHETFSNGAIPHYGYAISNESVRVAEKCGYKCDSTKLICRSLKSK